MGFSLIYLLFALPLLSVPIVLHLLTRKRPVQLPFPALRFLRSRLAVRQSHRRVRHWLLLGLRMCLLLIICCALIPPLRCNDDGLRAKGPGPRAAVLVFDTSASMEYNPGDRTRLDVALFQARAVIDSLPEDCRVALLDSADPPSIQENADRLTSKSNAGVLLGSIKMRQANAPLNGVVHRAARLLQQVADGTGGVIYVFSDRTRGCWDGAQAMSPLPAEVHAVFVDVGIDEPVDLAIDQVEVQPPVNAPGGKAEVRVRVRATGGNLESSLTCQFKDKTSQTANPQTVRLTRGSAGTYVFPFTVPEISADDAVLMPRQLTVSLATPDGLAVNNTRYATYLVRRPRKVLALADAPPPGKPSSAELLKAALEAVAVDQPIEAFRCDVRSVAEPMMNADDLLRNYAVVCLFEVTHPSQALWDTLKKYVQKGGGLLLVPGGDEVVPALADVNRGAEAGLAPARLINLVTSPAPGVGWERFDRNPHPLTANIRSWLEVGDPDFNRDGRRPAVGRSWDVGPTLEGSSVVARYTDKRPALLMRTVGQGKVVMLTSPLTGRRLEADRQWHNYWNRSSFGLVLVDQVCRFLDGTRSVEVPGPVNALCESGLVTKLPAPVGALPPYTLRGSGLNQSLEVAANADLKAWLNLPQAVSSGNYILEDANTRVVAGFSLNVPERESRLERVPITELENALGKGCVIVADPNIAITASRTPPALDLLPYLLFGLVLALTGETLFANLFARMRSPESLTSTQTLISRTSVGALLGMASGMLVGALIGIVWAFLFLSANAVFDTATFFALVMCVAGTVLGAGFAVVGMRGLGKLRLARSVTGDSEEESKWTPTPSIRS